jgi:glycosyltransferase involved in cell wall biosynthesis
LNAHYASGYGTTAALSKQNRVLLSVWGSDVFDFPQEGFLKRWLVRRNLRCATLIASTSHVMANRVRSLTPERNEIAITPFGVDMASFAPRRESQSPEVLTLGIVKTLADKYGVDLLLQAFAGLVDDPEVRSAASCRLLIVGDGPQREQLVKLATALGIERCTQFVGAVPHSDVPRWLEQMDIFIAPSRLDSESFGVAVIEASASGLPVVVSDVGGLPEVVRHDETGLIVPREDVSALKGALKRLVLDRGLRDQLGRQGRDHVATEFEWGHCVDLMERAYERTMTLARQ